MAVDVKTFVARENRPHQLLGLVDWKLVDQCTAADAVIRLYFAPSETHVTVTEITVDTGVSSSSNVVEPGMQAVLLVYDRASIRLLYRTEVQGSEGKGARLLKSLFSRLVKERDVLEVSPFSGRRF